MDLGRAIPHVLAPRIARRWLEWAMKLGRALSALVLGSILVWSACGGAGRCSGGPGTGRGQTPGPGSGASSVRPGDNVCGPASRSGGGGGGNSALIYYSTQSSSRIQAAGLNGSTLAPLALTTPTQNINAQMIFVKQKF